MDPITEPIQEGNPASTAVGATEKTTKYGSIIYRDLKAKGYRVYPVNPGRDEVDGDTAYPDIGDLPVTPDIVNIVVPPHQTLRVLQRAAELGIENVWVQPGAEDEAVLDYLEAGSFAYLARACIMVQARVKAAQ